MTTQVKGWALLLIHLVLVGSIAGKYAYERHTCPRVWVRATQYDPEQPLRGRYLGLTLHADACSLPRNQTGQAPYQPPYRPEGSWGWDVLLVAKDGKLSTVPARPMDVNAQRLSLHTGLPCEYASLDEPAEFFIAEHASAPFPLPKGQELWAEVTVPPSGPPRPLHLAVSDGKSFRVLDLR